VSFSIVLAFLLFLSLLRENVTPFLGPGAYVDSTFILWKIDQYGAFEGMIIQKGKPKPFPAVTCPPQISQANAI